MKTIALRLSAAAAAIAALAAPVQAQSYSWWSWWNWGGHRGGHSGGGHSGGGSTPASVPEIDASTGLLAIAAVLAVMAFVWERRRRQA